MTGSHPSRLDASAPAAPAPAGGPADPTLFRNGTVYSDADRFATAILLAAGAVMWLGDETGADAQVRAAERDGGGLEVVDLAGALLTPAFVDAVGGSGASGSALAGQGVVASLSSDSRAPWAAVVGDAAELDALDPGTVVCLDPTTTRLDLAALASAGVPLALGLATPDGGPWHRVQHALAAGLSARAAFLAHTRGAWRASARPDGPTLGRLAVGAPATAVVWDAEELVTQAADARRSEWSLDSRSGLAPLPRLGGLDETGWRAPVAVLTVRDGVVLHRA
ncbi:hypothetical protein [Litorihabitans aurantiacus]|uniref:Amidohydrolase family protein n=1 Tax=Litorihabitans aurantiacus TaxID=1930061 RepID=A0AA37UQT2_9MICO|nr:hypothetical protein [Litorihabitans aurantiacus]GMA31271.1 hypothetical protein GCM10025875_12630 [Litorihabitans aurantiacus]